MTVMTILGYMIIGLTVGWLSRMIYNENGLEMIPSLAFGILGAAIPTIIIYMADLAGAAIFAAIGAIAILFTINTFLQQQPEFEEA